MCATYILPLPCCFSVAKSYPSFCDPMNFSTLGFPVLHYLPEFAQIPVHWVSDIIQPSHPLSPASPLAIFWNCFFSKMLETQKSKPQISYFISNYLNPKKHTKRFSLPCHPHLKTHSPNTMHTDLSHTYTHNRYTHITQRIQAYYPHSSKVVWTLLTFLLLFLRKKNATSIPAVLLLLSPQPQF